MPQKLMDVLMLGRCSHEFSWPRRAADGHYYQVCLVCAAEYKYDWSTMRRTEQMQIVPEAATTRSEEHTSELQSRFDLVCRLLLEKKKKKINKDKSVLKELTR